MNTKDFETGVPETETGQVVLPDRVTHAVKKGPDHPSFFAKGMDDSTPGGAYFVTKPPPAVPLSPPRAASSSGSDVKPKSSTNSCSSSSSEGYSDDRYAPPAGWKFASAENFGNFTEAELTEMEQAEDEAENDSPEPAERSRSDDHDELGPNYGKRIFNDDSKLEFLPREEFGGRREGMVFRLGSMGLGYYEDSAQTKAVDAATQ